MSGCSVAQDAKDILRAGILYTAEGMRLRDAIRHAEIANDPVPDDVYESLRSMRRPMDALVDPEFRKQVQGLKDVTAALSSPASR